VQLKEVNDAVDDVSLVPSSFSPFLLSEGIFGASTEFTDSHKTNFASSSRADEYYLAIYQEIFLQIWMVEARFLFNPQNHRAPMRKQGALSILSAQTRSQSTSVSFSIGGKMCIYLCQCAV